MEAPAPEWRAPRRVATTPISLHTRHEASAQSGALVETLYYHPNMKIVSFTASARAFSISPSRRSDGLDKEEAGTLSWSSQLERTIAVGAFRIYRAPASVAFLSCGSALQPILPKSQSWCLDEANSRFVLQIRRPNYWRLELPVEEAEDQQLAQTLRGVLDSILQFEKTPCPFKRSFTVSLPEPPQEPVKKKPWKPVRRPLPDPGPPIPNSLLVPNEEAATLRRTRTMSAKERIRDESNYTSSPDHSSREASPAPDAAAELSAGLSLVRRPRTVPDNIVPVSTLVKQIDERSENETPSTPVTPITPMMVAAAIRRSTPVLDGREERRKPASVSPPLSNDGVVAPEGFDVSTIAKQAHVPRQRSVESINENENVEAVPITLPPQPTTTDTEHEMFQVPLSNDEAEPEGSQVPVSSDEATADHELEIHEGAGRQGGQRKVKLRRSTGFGSIRRIAPLSRRASLGAATPMPESSTPTSLPEPEDPGEASSAESEDSFHSVESWHSNAGLPPSPPASQTDSTAREQRQPFDDSSDAASERTEHTTTTAPDDIFSIAGKQTEVEAEVSTAHESERSRPKHRAPASYGSLRRRALSPLPPATLIYSPPATTGRSLATSNRLGAMRKLPMAIIAKTCSMLLGPPLHLLALMLKVAGRIAAGQWRGEEYGYGADGEQIPVHWDYSDGDLSDSCDEYEPYPATRSTRDEDD